MRDQEQLLQGSSVRRAGGGRDRDRDGQGETGMGRDGQGPGPGRAGRNRDGQGGTGSRTGMRQGGTGTLQDRGSRAQPLPKALGQLTVPSLPWAQLQIKRVMVLTEAGNNSLPSFGVVVKGRFSKSTDLGDLSQP